MIETLVSVVAPVEMDGPTVVEAFVDETIGVLRGLVSHYEVVLVDDGAPEETVAGVRTLLERHDFVRFLRLSRHFSEETAIAAGLDAAIGDYVVVMLPGMDPPALIPEFFERVRESADIVYGVRLTRKGEPGWYRWGARLFYWYMNGVVKAGIPKDSTQFRCMTRQVVNAITQIRDPDQYLRLLTSYVGFRKQALPYAPVHRAGAPAVRPKSEAINLARALVMDHTTHPLRTVLWVGVAVALVRWIVAGGGIEFFVLALMVAFVGEYVASLSRRMRDRPSYYVREEQTSSVLLREERRNVVEDTR